MAGFKTWLWKQARRDDPVGDLARDVRQDAREGCWTGRTPQSLREHIELYHSSRVDGVPDAIDRAELEWESA